MNITSWGQVTFLRTVQSAVCSFTVVGVVGLWFWAKVSSTSGWLGDWGNNSSNLVLWTASLVVMSTHNWVLILLVDSILLHLHCDINEVLAVFSSYSWSYPPSSVCYVCVWGGGFRHLTFVTHGIVSRRKVGSCVFSFPANRRVMATMLYSKSSGESRSACAERETLYPYKVKLVTWPQECIMAGKGCTWGWNSSPLCSLRNDWQLTNVNYLHNVD